MDMEVFSVGQRIPEWATGIDGCVMEYNNLTGLTLTYFLNSPNSSEVQAFDVSQNFKIIFTSIMDVGFFGLKVGELEWSDCAFSPNLYSFKPEFSLPEAGIGYALTLIFVDSATGEIKSMRLIGLGHEFSCQFRNWCLTSLQKNITAEHYRKVVGAVFARYTTLELVERAWIKWEL